MTNTWDRAQGALANRQTTGRPHHAERLAIEFAPQPRRAALVRDATFDLHARTARMLWQHGIPLHEVADHLLLAGPVTESWAVPVLGEAAREALEEGRFEAARDYLRQALSNGAEGGRHPGLEADLCEATWQLRPVSAVRSLPGLVPMAAAGDLGPVRPILLARRLAWHGRLAEAEAVLSTVDAGDGGRAAPAEQLLTDLWLGQLFPKAFGSRIPQVAARLAAAVDVLAGTRPWLRACAELAEQRSDGGTLAAESVLQALQPDRIVLEPLQLGLLTLDDAEQLDTASQWFTELCHAAETQGGPICQAQLTLARARVAHRHGDLTTCVAMAELSLRQLSAEEWGAMVGAPLGTLLMALTERGAHEQVAARLRLAIPPAATQTPWGLSYLRARGHHYLATGRPAAALSDFTLCGEIESSWGREYPGLAPWRLDAAQAYVAQGARGEARELVARQLAALGPGHARLRGRALRLQAMAEDVPRRRLSMLRASVDALEACGDWLELARSLGELGRTLKAHGRERFGHAAIVRAWNLARDCTAEALVRRLEDDGAAAGATGATEALVDVLSDAERRAAELAAQGFTNREIAQRLFVTPGTVEQHLTRVYRKLNVKGRKALASVAGLQPDVPARHGSCRPARAITARNR